MKEDFKVLLKRSIELVVEVNVRRVRYHVQVLNKVGQKVAKHRRAAFNEFVSVVEEEKVEKNGRQKLRQSSENVNDRAEYDELVGLLLSFDSFGFLQSLCW